MHPRVLRAGINFSSTTPVIKVGARVIPSRFNVSFAKTGVGGHVARGKERRLERTRFNVPLCRRDSMLFIARARVGETRRGSLRSPNDMILQ